MTKQTDKPGSKKMRMIGVVALIVVIIVIAIAMSKKSAPPTTSPAPKFQKQGTLAFLHADETPITDIAIEIADDDSKREVGLMGRPTMEEHEGMLFIFDEEFMASFWMKNTILPLDMIFVNKNGVIVTIHKNTTPFSEQGYNATAPTMFVVETIAGFTDKYTITVGDRIRWQRTR